MRIPACLFAALFWLCLAHGTTVLPPRFEELVSESEIVFRGRVTGLSSDWAGEPGRRYIATKVTFAVERILKGQGSETLTLQFLGGEIGGQRMQATGWPEFKVGDRGVFFVENRQGRMCPLVRLRHGRYRIASAEGPGEERVLRDDYTPLENVATVAAPLAERPTPPRAGTAAAGLALADFENQIVQQSQTPPSRGSSR